MLNDTHHDRPRGKSHRHCGASHHHHGSSGQHGGPPHWARGGGFRGKGGFGGGFPKGRKLSSADLQLVLLALLEQQPAHGYELIRALEEKSGGFYTPSPGVIYPALTYLAEIGHAEPESDGKRKLYRITDTGTAHLAENRDSASAILDALGKIASRMDEVREAFGGGENGEDLPEHIRAVRALKGALKRKGRCAPEEATRIAEILHRAIAEIETTPE